MSTNEEKNIGVVVDGHHDYSQTAAGYAVDERPLPCFGIGIGWLLFIVGLFLSAIPWYVGFLLLLFGRMDNREKAGLIACTFGNFYYDCDYSHLDQGTCGLAISVASKTYVRRSYKHAQHVSAAFPKALYVVANQKFEPAAGTSSEHHHGDYMTKHHD
ncbi:hypothetical protein ACFE04_011301 [Oxalis oulophora]